MTSLGFKEKALGGSHVKMADRKHVGLAGEQEGRGEGTWENSANGGLAYSTLQ